MISIFTNVSFWVLLLYILLVLWVSYVFRSQKNSDFLIGSNSIGFWPTTLSLAAGMRDGGGLAIWVFMGIVFGIGSLSIVLGAVFAFMLLAYFATRIHRLAQKHQFITINDFIGFRFGTKTKTLSQLIVLWFAFFYATANLFVGGSIIAALLDVSATWGISITALTVGFYLVIGGYRNVVYTDVFQWLLLLLVFVVPFFLKTDVSVGASLISFASMDYHLAFFIGGLLFTIFFSSPDVWQRIFSSQDETVAKKSLLASIFFYLCLTIGLILLGVALSQNFDFSDPQKAFFAFFQTGTADSLLLSLVAVMGFAALMSTLDTQTFLFSSTLAQLINHSNKNRSQTIKNIIVLIILLMVSIASQIGDFISFFFSSTSLISILFPVLLSGLLVKDHDDKPAFYALLIGMITYFYCFLSGLLDTNVAYNLLPVGICTLVLLVLRGIKKN